MISNSQSGTTIDEVAPDTYRISTPLDIPAIPGGFTISQYLILDEQPLLFHTGLRRMFPLVQEAISKVLPADRLRHVGFSHYEGDESGALNEFLAIAPQAEPFSSDLGAMVSINDVADRPGLGLADGQKLSIGKHQLRWINTPHVPHGWDCGVLFDETTGTLFCGDLFAQSGSQHAAVTESEVLTPSEMFRKPMDYFAMSKGTGAILRKLAALNPTMLACMHGSAYRGDGSVLLNSLAQILHQEVIG